MYVRQTIGADHLIIERDSASIMGWIQRWQGRGYALAPCDILRLLKEWAHVNIRHIYYETNNIVDQIVSVIAEHRMFYRWMWWRLWCLSIIFLFNSLGCIHIRFDMCFALFFFKKSDTNKSNKLNLDNIDSYFSFCDNAFYYYII